jgi:mono/diheme cytochrome c family protein
MSDEKANLRRGEGDDRDDTDISPSLRLPISPSPHLPVSVSPRLPISPSPRLPIFLSPYLPVAASPRRRVFVVLLTVHCLLFTVSCRQDMQDQPRMKPFRSTTFFRDGMSSRPPVPGTVARGHLNADTEFFTGKKRGTQAGTSAPAGQQTAPTGDAAQGTAAYPDDVEEFPLPITHDVVKRGKERYDIFCSACHGMTGNGDGMIVRRGFRRAASFHSEGLRQAPVGHYFDAITNGWGAMPPYAAQIPARDRWAIVAYIRALQLSYQNPQSQPGQPQPSASPAPTPGSGGHD